MYVNENFHRQHNNKRKLWTFIQYYNYVYYVFICNKIININKVQYNLLIN